MLFWVNEGGWCIILGRWDGWGCMGHCFVWVGVSRALFWVGGGSMKMFCVGGGGWE